MTILGSKAFVIYSHAAFDQAQGCINVLRSPASPSGYEIHFSQPLRWPIQFGGRHLPQIHNLIHLLKEPRNALCSAFSKQHLCCIILPPSGRSQNSVTKKSWCGPGP